MNFSIALDECSNVRAKLKVVFESIFRVTKKKVDIETVVKIKPNLSLYLLNYTEVCNEFAGPISDQCTQETQLHMKKRGEPLTTLCPISSARDMSLKPPAPETNALPLDQLAGL